MGHAGSNLFWILDDAKVAASLFYLPIEAGQFGNEVMKRPSFWPTPHFTEAQLKALLDFVTVSCRLSVPQTKKRRSSDEKKKLILLKTIVAILFDTKGIKGQKVPGDTT